MVFAWLPVIFTFTMGASPPPRHLLDLEQHALGHPASLIMKKAGAKIELWDNHNQHVQKKSTS